MKKYLLTILLAVLSITVLAQTGTGWAQQRSKVNFKDSTNFEKEAVMKTIVIGLEASATGFSIDSISYVGVDYGVYDGATLLLPAGVKTLIHDSIHIHIPTNVSSTEIGYLNGATGTTGTGNLVFGTSPTFVTPLLGTPTSGVMTNVTGTAAGLTVGGVSSPFNVGGSSVTTTGPELEYVTNVTSDIQTQLNARKYQDYDYYIEEVAGTVYARPSPNSTYTAYNGAILSGVINSAMGQLTNGGEIFIKAGNYVNCDSIRVPYDSITIRGEGMYKTILKLKDDFDAGKSLYGNHGFIACEGKDYFVIKDLQLDGNGANQTYIDNGISGDGIIGRICGLNILADGVNKALRPIVENVYIHDFTELGCRMWADDGIIRNSLFIDCFHNGVTLYVSASRCSIENCRVEGSGDVGFTAYGTGHVISNCIVGNQDGAFGSTGTRWGLGIEGGATTARDISLLNNIIKGDSIIWGIGVSSNTANCVIDGNVIDDVLGASGIGIRLAGDSGSVVRNNRITNVTNYAISLGGCLRTEVSNNYCSSATGTGSINIAANGATNSTYNLIKNNYFNNPAGYGLIIAANCDYNRIIDNWINGTAWGDINQSATATSNTIWNNNYGVKTGGWLTKLNNALHDQTRLFNILDYGADPTGVTDATDEIKAAIAAAKAVTTMATVYFPAGTYLISDTLVVTGDVNTFAPNLKGEGFATIIYNTGTTPTLCYRDASYCKIEGLHLKGDAANGTGLLLDHTRYIVLEDLTIRLNGSHGIDMYNGSWGNNVEGCTITQNGGDGIFAVYKTGDDVTGSNANCLSVIDCNIRDNDDDGIEWAGAAGLTLTGNKFEGNHGSGVQLGSVQTIGNASGILINGNYFEENDSAQIYIIAEATPYSIEGLTVEGNTFIDAGTGATLNALIKHALESGTSYFTLKNSYFGNNYYYKSGGTVTKVFSTYRPRTDVIFTLCSFQTFADIEELPATAYLTIEYLGERMNKPQPAVITLADGITASMFYPQIYANIAADVSFGLIADGFRGQKLMITGDDASLLTIKDTVGVNLAGNMDCILGVDDWIELEYYGDDWTEVARSEPNTPVSVIKKTIGWHGATNVDFTWPDDANTTAHNENLGAIIPAKCVVTRIDVVCTESLTGPAAHEFAIVVGNASAGDQFVATGSIDDINNVLNSTAAKTDAVPMVWNTTASVWVQGTPDGNWNEQTTGKWTVYITYMNYNGR